VKYYLVQCIVPHHTQRKTSLTIENFFKNQNLFIII
jgi:hypothetical protein